VKIDDSFRRNRTTLCGRGASGMQSRRDPCGVIEVDGRSMGASWRRASNVNLYMAESDVSHGTVTFTARTRFGVRKRLLKAGFKSVDARTAACTSSTAYTRNLRGEVETLTKLWRSTNGIVPGNEKELKKQVSVKESKVNDSQQPALRLSQQSMTPHSSTETVIMGGGQFFCDRIDDECICKIPQLQCSPGTT
jgi:hypothetical protein